MCARIARSVTSREVVLEFWRMANEYQAKAAELGEQPDNGHQPPQI
jgi:hypothetical protein